MTLGKQLRIEILSGLTISFALIPEAIAFSIICNVNPMIGIFSCIVIGLITSILGGRPGMISGATGAIALVVATLVLKHGIDYMVLAIILGGILQLIFAIFKQAKLIELIPQCVLNGFVNGLGILIFMSQMRHLENLGSIPLLIMLMLVIFTMILIYQIPRFTKKIPSALLALLITSIVVIMFQISTTQLSEIADLSKFKIHISMPDVAYNIDTLLIILPYSLMIAIVGLTESLLTLKVVSKILKTNAKPNQEAMAQGLANISSGLFGGMGGCAFIGQSVMNVSQGGSTRISSISSVIGLTLLVIFCQPLIGQIPMAALIGIMIVIAFKTINFDSLKNLKDKPKFDTLIMLLVMSIIIIFHNLAVAVIIGTIIHILIKKYITITDTP